MAIPQELASRNQWVCWKTVMRNGEPTKMPFTPVDSPASSTDPATWSSLEACRRNVDAFDGLGFVFSKDDPFTGIDLDGCRFPDGQWADWARKIIKEFNTYTELSPSRTGAKMFIVGDSPFDGGKQTAINEPKTCDKFPGVEVYSHSRYFAVTGTALAGLPKKIESRQSQLVALCARFWPMQTAVKRVVGFDSNESVLERARKYLAKCEPAISGQKGHNTTFRVACVLRLGFDLSNEETFRLLSEWNQRCQPPWSEKELWHKVEDAAKQDGERGYLKHARDASAVTIPDYKQPELTTLESSAKLYLDRVTNGGEQLVSLGLGDLDYALGGGVEYGELVILAARPSHGKSAVALQAMQNLNEHGIPTAFVSEEMSAMALGKRAIHFASSVSAEHWKTRSDEVGMDLTHHFGVRKPCYVIEGCRTAENAAEQIRRLARDKGVKAVAVDYAQLLQSKGGSRYEQITNTSIALRGAANDSGVLLIVLCQLNRQIEARNRFEPKLSDLRDSGQLEQDADVIVFLVWPHRIDEKKDESEYKFYVAKNRNRPINQHVVECSFEPGRQRVRSPIPWKTSTHVDY